MFTEEEVTTVVVAGLLTVKPLVSVAVPPPGIGFATETLRGPTAAPDTDTDMGGQLNTAVHGHRGHGDVGAEANGSYALDVVGAVEDNIERVRNVSAGWRDACQGRRGVVDGEGRAGRRG